MQEKYFIERFSGTREEIGRALGRFYQEHGLAWFRPAADPGELSEKQLSYALRQLELVKEYNSGLVEELRGLADGLGIPFERAAAISLASGMRGPTPGCTAFVARTGNGDIYLARNFDFRVDERTVYLARVTSPLDAYRTFGGTEALLGYTEGINEHGVAIAMAGVPMGDYDWEFLLPNKPPERGMLFSLAIRTALERCDSAQAAAEFLSSIPHLEPFNFLIADPFGEVFVVEAAPWRCEVHSGTPEGGMIITNMFSTPSMEEGHGEWKWTDEAQARLQRTLNGLRERAIKQCLELAKGAPGGLDERKIFDILRMAAFDYWQGDPTHTIWSASFNLTKKAIWWCRGTPRRHRFEQLGRLE